MCRYCPPRKTCVRACRSVHQAMHALMERESRIGMGKTQMMHTKRATVRVCRRGQSTPLPPQAVNRETWMIIKTTSKKYATCSLVTPWRRYEGSYRSSGVVQGLPG